jgi:hypothetical protein
MILGDVQVPGKHLQCDQCRFDWISIAKDLPDFCPNRECRSREWNGKKTKRKPARQPAIQLPSPRKVRKSEFCQDDTDTDF